MPMQVSTGFDPNCDVHTYKRSRVDPVNSKVTVASILQGRIDGQYLKSGERDYSRLPNLYVITILPYDPFGQDFMVYPFQNMCRELPELDYPDGLRYIYFREGNEPKSDLSGLWRLPASSILP